jgi:hypothetical protein
MAAAAISFSRLGLMGRVRAFTGGEGAAATDEQCQPANQHHDDEKRRGEGGGVAPLAGVEGHPDDPQDRHRCRVVRAALGGDVGGEPILQHEDDGEEEQQLELPQQQWQVDDEEPLPAPRTVDCCRIEDLAGDVLEAGTEDEKRQARNPREVDEDQRPERGVRVAEPVLLETRETDFAEEVVQHADLGVVDEPPGKDLDDRGEGERNDEQVAEEQSPPRPRQGDQ